MHRLFVRVLSPAPTLPLDPYKWRRDNRNVSEKVVSGIRLGGGLIAGFLVLALALAGISTLPAGAPAYGRYGALVSWSMVCTSSIIMFWTTNRWAPYVPGFFFLPALFKILWVVLAGPNPHSPISYHRLSRAEAAEIFAVCIAVVVLTWRFVGGRPAFTTLLDRLALTFFVLAAIRQVTISYQWPPLPLLSGLFALLIAWCVYQWKPARKHWKQTEVDSG